jgi:hypothetical protein
MQKVGSAQRFVIARENNVVLVDFRRPDPPGPVFPGAAGLRAGKRLEDELCTRPSTDSPLRHRVA